ncbi:MAG: hypothetical protein PUC39_05805, partial [Lachnospiraceae bacterium]|nr:hypothetical protein [Lachnospiraceae bacterium]
LTGGSVTVNAAVTPVQANKVVWIGTQVQSDSGIVFSVEPVDADGNLVNQCNVTYKDGTSVKTNFVRKDELFTLPSPKDPNGEHEGYKAVGWTVEGSEVILAVGSTQTVSADTVYVAVYTEITGSLQVSVADTDGLVYGYTTDAGVEVTITNNTNVTIDSIKAQLEDETKFTLSKTSITSLAAGESATLKVTLKNGQSVNTYSTNLIITVSSKECDGDEVVINRTVIKKKLPTPTKTPTVQTVTDTSVTLVPVQDSDYTYQYGYKKASDTSYEWQNSNEITGLLPYTAYDFALRYKETANASASDAGTAVSQTTLMSDAGKYVIDVSKLGDEDYIAAHGGTISVKGNGLTLEEEHTYTITGKNENLTVSALEDVTIVLDNAEISGITGSKNVILELKGTSKIDSKTENVSGITVTNKVTISQSEDADAASVTIQGGAGAAGINADEVVITSGTVSATGGENAAGIEGEKVTISGGTVQVTGSGDAPAIVAEEKDIADTVKLNNGDNYEEGGNENPGTPDPTPTPNPTPTPDPTPTPNPTPTPTPGPTPAQPSNPGNSTADTNTGDTTVDEADDEEDEEVITPALTAANILLQKGKSYTLTTNHEDVEITKISYVNSKSKKLVKVFSSGKIKAQKTGTAKLKVTYEYDGVSYNKNVTVKVQKNPVLVIAKKKLSITLKRKAKCNFVNPSNMLSSKGMKFKTSSKKVLTVSSKGMVTAKSRGTAKVTVTISGEKYVVNVKVK